MARKRVRGALSPALTKTFELSLAAPQVIAMRSMMMLATGTADPRTAREMTRMTTEKVQAWQESMTAMGMQMQRAQQEWALAAMRQWTAWLPGSPRAGRALPDPAQVQKAASRILHSGLAPVHRRATANAKRLSRKKR